MIVATLTGLLFGFVASMPIAGPISALVFERAVRGRMREGFSVAIGAAAAEAVYAALAFWGFASLLERYAWIQSLSDGLAAVILAVLGVLFLCHRRTETSNAGGPERSGTGLLLGFTVTALNPTLIATWSAASAMLLSTGLVDLQSHHALPFGLGALLGIVLWFATLLRLVGRFRERFSYPHLVAVIRFTGGALLVLAAWFGWRLIT